MSAETAQGGVVINVIPREGGNSFSGYAAGNFSTSELQGSNLTDELRALGLGETPPLRRLYDIGASVGGPIVRDRVWFFTAHRLWGAGQYKPNSYFNATQDSWFYTPDLSRPGFTDSYFADSAFRLTWQASQRNRLNFAFNRQMNCDCGFQLLTRNAAPEATAEHHYNPNWAASVIWSAPVTNRLLLQAVLGYNHGGFSNKPMPGVTRDTISVTELSTNFQYRSRALNFNPPGSYGNRDTSLYNARVAASYVTGTHNLKSGVVLQVAKKDFTDTWLGGGMSYSFRNGVPVQVRLWALPFEEHARIRNLGVFVQDQWTVRDRLTLNLGVRYEHLVGWTPPQDIPAGPLVPRRTFERVDDVPNLKDLLPRVGFSYDLSGSGTTAIKAFVGRFLPVESLNGFASLSNPVNRMVTSATRNWTDTNGNFVPDCDLSLPQANAECGPLSDVLFGQVRPGTTYADDVLRGFGNRYYNWQSHVALQHELRPGLSVEAGYFRTWYGNFTVTDNVLVTPQDYDHYCVAVPSDARLPGAGQQRCGLYDLNPSKFGQVSNVVKQASEFGEQTEVFNGIDLLLKARFGRGGQFQGGLSTGSTAVDNCLVVDVPTQGAEDFCRVSSPWLDGTNVRFFAVYPTIWGLQASLTYQNLPGIAVSADHVVTSAAAAPSLGRPLSGGANATRIVEIIPTSSGVFTDFLDRRQQLDLRLSKIFNIGGFEVKGDLDIYNLMNAGYVLQHNTRYGATWLAPQQVLQARLLKLGFQLEF